MKLVASALFEEYKAAFHQYLSGGGENALHNGYEIGRRALGGEAGALDLVALHREVVLDFLRENQSVADPIRTVQDSWQFLIETLSPLEMTVRGFQDALEAVKMSEERYRTLIDTARDVIYTLSADGTIRSLNRIFNAITGWPTEEWIGKPFVPLVHPEDLPLAMAIHERVLRGETPPAFEIRIRSKSGEYLVGEFTTTPEFHDGEVVGTFGIARDISDRKRVQEQLRALAKRVVEAQEEERRRLARDLHDDICQWLSGMKLSLGLLEENVPNAQTLRKKLRKMKRQFNQRIIEVRRASSNLRPAILDDFGLSVALRRLCEAHKRGPKMKLAFQDAGATSDRFPAEVEIAIYRIAQEGLSNVVRHSKATRAKVSLVHDGTHLVLEIEDNGTGIESKKLHMPKAHWMGIGLVSMKERAELLGGTMQIHSSPNRGTRIRVDIPVTGSQS